MRFSGPATKILSMGWAVLWAATASAQTAATPPTPPSSAAAASSQGSASKNTAHKKSRKGKRSRKTANWRKHGQQKIDAQRTREIQEALIREHYLEGESSGVWDAATEKAMQKYQADNGWQSKTTPDARALIKLGLGPDQQHLLNPETAMTGGNHSQADPPAAAPSDSPPRTPQN